MNNIGLMNLNKLLIMYYLEQLNIIIFKSRSFIFVQAFS